MSIITTACGWIPYIYEYGHCDTIATNHLGSYFIHVVALGVVGAIFAIAILYFANKSKRVWNFVSSKLLFFFVLTWLFGFAVYDVGMYTGEKLSILLNAPMAVLHSFGMFILDSDISAIHEEFHDNTVFMACFSAAHFIAAIINTPLYPIILY